MKNYLMTLKSYILLLLCIPIVSCTTDRDDEIRPATTLELSEFIYRGLNYWSLYKSEVPALANDRFESNQEKLDFLRGFDSPEETFEALIAPIDRFSILRSDYVELENALAGVRKSTGMRFSILEDPNNSNNRFGVVRYVINNSPAASAGVSRGMLFTAVDGVNLTAASDLNAIFAQDTFTINLASYDGTALTPTGEAIALDNIELTINPVHTTSIIETPTKKIGYLHYTGFTNEFDPELNSAFSTFKAEGVEEFILDLRYNGGGSVETANDLCAMITGQFEGQEFITQQYNADRNPENQFVRRFNNKISSGAAINSLNLSRLIVLTTSNTASSSELVLSGLAPYINITQIGTNTRGKFEGSFLLYDAPEPNFSRSMANPNHRYVMLPLVLKAVNANGLTNYFDGFTPDIALEEDPFNLGVLGDTSDPFIAAAVDVALGRQVIQPKTSTYFDTVLESDQSDLLYQRMIVGNN